MKYPNDVYHTVIHLVENEMRFDFRASVTLSNIAYILARKRVRTQEFKLFDDHLDVTIGLL